MATTTQGVTLIAMLALGLGLTYIAIQAKMLPYAFAAAIAWLVPLIALGTGTIGPGIGVLWVQAICLAFILMAFAPVLMQMRVEVWHERRMGDGGMFNWKSYQKRGWTPESQVASYDRFRKNLSEITERANATHKGIARARQNYASKLRDELVDR